MSVLLTAEQARQIEEALNAVKQMCEIAHPQFNWGASFLQADGIKLLNEAPQAAAKALATIRAARAQGLNLNCKSVQARLATSWGYVKQDHSEQNLNMVQEQEPVAFADLYSVAGKLALELECLLLDTKDLSVVSKWWDSAHDALEQWRLIKDTAPVRTKDLTAEEIQELWKAETKIQMTTRELVFARAVIAADREKQHG